MKQTLQKLDYINIGCGPLFHPAWINIDLYKALHVIKHDIRKPLPFNDNSMSVVYHSHTLEHLSKEDGKRFITECYRILKPGGVMRIVIPDLEQVTKEYLKNLELGFSSLDERIIRRYQWNKIEIFDQILRQNSGGEMIEALSKSLVDKEYMIQRIGTDLLPLYGSYREQKTIKKIHLIDIKSVIRNFFIHLFQKNPKKSGEVHKWLYDRLDLKLLIEGVGFKNFIIVNYKTSRIPNWELYNFDKAPDYEGPRKPESLFIEVIK